MRLEDAALRIDERDALALKEEPWLKLVRCQMVVNFPNFRTCSKAAKRSNLSMSSLAIDITILTHGRSRQIGPVEPIQRILRDLAMFVERGLKALAYP